MLNAEEGRKLFELGMAHATRYDSEKAIEYYTRSIAASPNPSPYINRANLLCKRLRYHEALHDLLEARKLDRAQSNEFTEVLRREIGYAEAITNFYRNGLRDRLLEDLDRNGDDFVAGKIFSASFGFSHNLWENGYIHPLSEHHFFNELDNVRKFDRLNLYPEVEGYIENYPIEFIEMKVSNCKNLDYYQKASQTLHSFLCSYDEQDMISIRRIIIYRLHESILDDEYGMASLSNSYPEVTKEAYRFIHGEEFSEEDI